MLIDTIEEAGKSAKYEYKDDLKAIRAEMATKADMALLDAKIERLELRLTVKLGTFIAIAVGIVATLIKFLK